MKRIISILLVLSMMLSMGTTILAEDETTVTMESTLDVYDDAEMELFSQDKSKYFNTGYELTGIPSKDIVIVAEAQLDEDLESVYTEAWCANFVTDCARLTGMDDSIIPYNYVDRGACRYLIKYMQDNCDAVEVSSPKQGDLVFYYCDTCSNPYPHVGIVMDSSYSIEGNSSNKVRKVSLTSKFTDIYGHSCERVYIRPNYGENTEPVITSANGDNHTEITVKWSKVSDATKYKVLRRKAGDSDYVTAKSSTTETSFTDTGLEKNKRYYYKVVAYDGSKELGTSDAVGAYTKFDTPTIKAESASKLSLSWDSVSYAESYTVRRRVEGGEYDDVKTVTETTFTDSGLTAGTKYYYWIQANCVVNDEEITAKSTSSSQYTLPEAPSITSIDDTSKTEITIKWNAVNSATSYRIEHRKAGIGTVYETVGASITETTFTDIGLETGQRYYYKVYAVNNGGESSASSAVGGYTKFNEPTIKPISETEISLSWDTITAAGSYTIRQRIDGGEYVDVATVTGTSYTDSGLVAGTRYYYWIQANCVVDGTSYVAKSLSKSGMTLTYLNVGYNFNAYITHAPSGLALTQDNDGNVVVRSNTAALNQRWMFERQSDGSYKIKSNSNNRLLDVYGGIDLDGNNVAAYDDNGGGSNQRWFVVDDGTTILLKPASGICVLDVANGHVLPVAEGTNVQVCSNNDSSAQEFYINIIDKYALDVNGVINGEYSSHTIGFGTFDVYIDGVINEDDVSDFYLYIPIGSKYEIKDIKANEGYTYKGLAKGDLTGSVNNDVDTQLMFDANTYTVQYNGNGATSGFTTSSSHTYNALKELTANGFVKSNYKFAGWNTKADGTGTSYGDCESVMNLTSEANGEVILYAQWESTVIPVEAIILNETTLTLTEGEVATLLITIMPDNATDKSVAWTSSDESIAAVEDGIVIALSSGSTIITVTANDGSKQATCVVNVEESFDYTVENLTGTVINGRFYAEAEVVKNTDRDNKDMIVIAVYKDGVMIDMVYMKANFAKGETVSFGGMLGGVEGATLKAFVWDSMTGMKSLSNTIEK